ncbi:MAG TPA: primosomal protein N' [Actinobacteria bacterium]|nr:primosomal protein N' [Actinomycetota bacterium]
MIIKNSNFYSWERNLLEKIARVIVDIISQNVDRPFDYLVPSDLASRVQVGSQVLVSFRHRLQLGYVVGFTAKPAVKNLNLIIDVLDEDVVFDEKMLSLCRWIGRRYISSLSETLKLTFPPGKNRHLKQEIILQTEDDVGLRNLAQEEAGLVEVLREMGGKADVNSIRKLYPKGLPNLIGNLERKNIITKKYLISNPRINMKTEECVTLNTSAEEAVSLMDCLRTRAPKQKRILSLLVKEKVMPVNELLFSANSSRQSLKSLVDKNVVTLSKKPTFREPDFFYPEKIPLSIKLTDEQCDVLAQIKNSINKEGFVVQLLQGVTSSGKTEVYLQAIAEILSRDKTAIVLVPEIALTPQMVHRFRSRFGNTVAALHSGLGLGERFDQWKRIKHGDFKVVVGARSALFAPLKNLGLIIIDEEYEVTYKQNCNPRYHAREVAKKRAQLSNALLLLGSATPSIESKHEAERGAYELLRLTKRVGDRKFPQIEIVDMRARDKVAKWGIFSDVLLREIETCIDLNKKIILFLNRRGYAGFVLCKDCGHVLKCKRCDVSLVYHADDKTMRCHHCGYIIHPPDTCPKCKGYKMGRFGIGTQRVESEVKKFFPDIPLIRMDADTTQKKDSHRKKLIAFKNLECGILLGTQMIAKGLDFPDVALVGVINADTALHLPDFRASERTFQLLMQLSGRAGRGKVPGKVIIQTYCPDSYAISAVKKYTYDEFYKEEIEIRKELDYPPFSELVNIIFSGKEEKCVMKEAHLFNKRLDEIKDKEWLKDCLGPAPSPLSKIKCKYRWHTILKTKDSAMAASFLKEHLSDLISKKSPRDVNITIDIDPIWTL